jgi:hypothetical protein
MLPIVNGKLLKTKNSGVSGQNPGEKNIPPRHEDTKKNK